MLIYHPQHEKIFGFGELRMENTEKHVFSLRGRPPGPTPRGAFTVRKYMFFRIFHPQFTKTKYFFLLWMINQHLCSYEWNYNLVWKKNVVLIFF